MASFLKGILGGGALVLALWVVLWAGQLGKAHPNNQWINEAIAYKTQASPRTFFPQDCGGGRFGSHVWH